MRGPAGAGGVGGEGEVGGGYGARGACGTSAALHGDGHTLDACNAVWLWLDCNGCL